MKCPRCGSLLQMVEPSPVWLRHFRCEECWRAWRLEATRHLTTDPKNARIRYFKNDTYLTPGRNRRPELTDRIIT